MAVRDGVFWAMGLRETVFLAMVFLEIRGATAGADPSGSGPGRASRGVSRGSGSDVVALCGEASIAESGSTITPWTGAAAVGPSVTSAETGRGSRASTEEAASCSTWRAWAVSGEASIGIGDNGNGDEPMLGDTEVWEVWWSGV
jgi:hypothetical protein